MTSITTAPDQTERAAGETQWVGFQGSARAGAVVLFALALGLTGCAVGPKYVRPEVPVSQHWAEEHDTLLTTQTPPDTAWWRTFNDPVLDSLIVMAYRQNLPLQVAGLRILESRAQLAVATGRRYPQIQVAFANASAVGLSGHTPNTFGLFDRYYWDYQVGFDAAWEADFWGKYGHDVRAEEATYYVSITDYDEALVSLAGEVARIYTQIRTFETQIDLARANVAVQEEGERIARSRFRNGATSELDPSQATTLLESTRATIPLLEISLQQAENALSTLLAQPTGSLQALLQGTNGIPTPPAQVAVYVPAEMLRRRPDIHTAELNAVAQSDRIGIAKSDLYPSFSLVGTIGTEANSGVSHQPGGSLFDSKSFFYLFGPRLVWPLFNYGRIQNNVRVQDARLQQLLVDYQLTVLQAAQEVEDGMVGFVKAREAVTFQQNAANSAQRSVDLAFIQYREGAVDFQRVLDATRALLQEQQSLAQARSSVATNLIALYKALGGGWEMRRGQAVVAPSTQQEMQKRTNWGDFFENPPPSTLNGSSPTPR